MSRLSPFPQSSRLPDRKSRFAQVIAEAFYNDPLNRWLRLGDESKPDNPKLQNPQLALDHWLPLVRGRADNGGVLVQTYDWAAVALWLPPGIQKPPYTTTHRGILEYRDKFDALKAKTLGDRSYWYLNLIARSPSRADKGAIRGVIDPFIEKARQQEVPLWLEAISEHARDVYAHLGFRVVETVVIGAGAINEQGWVEDGGSGVKCWGMVANL
ncbi:hypothetical protein, variant [Exophiala mesophila]|uniref:N-acetyltransferase domain-containing protein n=1 Tax=Exophiala mesophila TaxID=212818 RepID=A0A0D1WGY4_EXOME|nr:hypothetical protein, variant [Exophiala mesophila]KIV88030.1 hypothetical protein, variant [Exophiala mesophila]